MEIAVLDTKKVDITTISKKLYCLAQKMHYKNIKLLFAILVVYMKIKM